MVAGTQLIGKQTDIAVFFLPQRVRGRESERGREGERERGRERGRV